MKKLLAFNIGFIILLASSLSFTNYTPAKYEVPEIPENIKSIIDKSCYGCHNTNSRNEDAKEELDFNKLDKLSFIKAVNAYKQIGETVEENEMPPKKFLEKKPEKKLTTEEKQILITWAKKEAETLIKNR